MIRSENQLFHFQLSKGIFHIDGAKAGAVAADHDNFVVPELVDRLDRIFQPRREVAACLPVNLRSRWDGATAGSKKMHIDPMRKFGTKRGKF